jgi:ribosomal protein S18 acetylase RimI-like enzyme
MNYSDELKNGIIELWNSTAVNDGYKELDAAGFYEIFENNPYFNSDSAFVMEDHGVCGFACGCTGSDLPLGDMSGYITCIILSKDKQNQENFHSLLHLLEQSFQKKGKKQSEVLFFNPIMLPWYIPGTPKHEHNNAPGAATDTWYYKALLASGYAERARECAMYLNLSNFEIPEAILEKEKLAKVKGYEVDFFDPSRHSGVPEMLHSLGNSLWQREIVKCTSENIPVIVAVKQGEAAGFAGPVIRQDNGRAYFTGIGVSPAHEGNGLGTILFFKLCEAFKNINAEYMSLYTGIKNPAINIYKKAGFIPVRVFAVMRKELM